MPKDCQLVKSTLMQIPELSVMFMLIESHPPPPPVTGPSEESVTGKLIPAVEIDLKLAYS